MSGTINVFLDIKYNKSMVYNKSEGERMKIIMVLVSSLLYSCAGSNSTDQKQDEWNTSEHDISDLSDNTSEHDISDLSDSSVSLFQAELKKTSDGNEEIIPINLDNDIRKSFSLTVKIPKNPKTLKKVKNSDGQFRLPRKIDNRKPILLPIGELPAAYNNPRFKEHGFESLDSINLLRLKKGLNPLQYDERMSAVAFRSSHWMVENNQIRGHPQQVENYASVVGNQSKIVFREGTARVPGEFKKTPNKNSLRNILETSEFHKEAMLTPKFTHAGVGAFYHKESKRWVYTILYKGPSQ